MFNKSQIQAISHREGPAIVLAGPGSGKTTVITHRIKNLIERAGVSPENILVVTFTKAAAVHMKERFHHIMDQNGEMCRSYPVAFGTFHSIYYRILRLAYDYKSDNIVSDRMKYDFLKEIVIRLKLDVDSMQDFVSSVSGEISRLKGNMYNIDEYQPKCCKRENFKRIFYEYEKELKSAKKIDFEDMLLRCHELLLEREDILRQWQNVFRYILIDEFQDINKIQYEIIKMLASPEDNIFVVGDDDQSIYGFRGACPEIMLQFKRDYPKAQEIFLNINYRSTPDIVQLSRNLIVHNKNRFDKQIVSLKKKGLRPDIRKFGSQGEQLKYLCCQIKKYIRNGIRPGEIVILVRNNIQITGVRDFLCNEMIDTYNARGKNAAYQGMVAKDVIAYIKAALCNEKVWLSENKDLIYILNKPSRFISRQVIGQEKMDFEGLKRVYKHSREVLKQIEQLQFHLKMIAGLNPSAALTYIRNGTGYEKYLQQYAMERKIKLTGLIKQFDKIQKESLKFTTLKEWLAYIDMQSKIQEEEENREKVNIMTMHGSKGLEFKAVFIIDANQGIVPSSKAVRERDFQEERRVFYVAMTRAAEILNIYGVEESLGCSVEISMFVSESLESSQEI
ncbi:MAG: ATP-dependent helicase [Eubacterium sp.]